jgi:hypothetical protein
MQLRAKYIFQLFRHGQSNGRGVLKKRGIPSFGVVGRRWSPVRSGAACATEQVGINQVTDATTKKIATFFAMPCAPIRLDSSFSTTARSTPVM